MYTYTWYQWLSFFYIYCFVGWIFESSYVSAKEGRLVNRGFLRLPLLPLYGTGAVMMLWVSLPFQDSLVLVYLSGFVAATALEYVTGWTMERLFKVKYWDYSDKKIQLNGYICLSSSIAWGFLTIFLTEVLHRAVSELIFSIPVSLLLAGDAVISVLFVWDTIQSVRDALDLRRALESMTRLKAELDDVQVQMALLKAEAIQRISDYRDETAGRMESLRGETAERMEQLREDAIQLMNGYRSGTTDLTERWKADAARLLEQWMEDTSATLSELKNERLPRLPGLRLETLTPLLDHGKELLEKRRSFTEHLNRNRRNLLLRNPHAGSRRFDSALKELYSIAEKQRKQQKKH